jgi:hypothetical protein
MNTKETTLNKLITISQYNLFSRQQRRNSTLNIHHINIMINIYLLQVLRGKDDITLTDLTKLTNYIEFKKIKLIIYNDLINVYVLCREDKYYYLSDEGICLVDDILNNYEIVYRSFIEKHKLNEAF